MRYWILSLAALAALSAIGPGMLAEPPRPPAKALTLTVGSTVRLEMTSKKLIKTVINEKETVARVSAIEGDPRAVLVTGLNPGFTRITLIAADDEKEVHEIGKPPGGR